MNAVIYFSCSGQSKLLAEGTAEKLGFGLFDFYAAQNIKFETAVIIFPVHCQGLPVPLKKLLRGINAEYAVTVATYGKQNPGNALYEAAKLLSAEIIAAAYLPAGHTYDGELSGPVMPEEIFEKIKSPSAIKIPKRKKTPFAAFMPSLRSRLIIKIKRFDNCTKCNRCADVCPSGAINYGKTNSKCIRCMKCVYQCPEGAIKFKKGILLTRFLKKHRIQKSIIYI